MSPLVSIWFWLTGAAFLAGLTVYYYFYDRQKTKDLQIKNLIDSLENTRVHNQQFVAKNREMIENYLTQNMTVENLQREVQRLKNMFERTDNDNQMLLNEHRAIEIMLD